MIFFIVSVILLLPPKISLATQVECFCTTRECQLQNSTWCLTSEMCYTQWYDRPDGSRSVYRGCIIPGQSSSLLCLNQRPSLENTVSVWPLLVCCGTNRCNENVRIPMTNSATVRTEPDATTISSSSSSSTSPRTTTSMTAVERDALSEFGVSSLEELKKKIEEQKQCPSNSDDEGFPQMVHLFIIGTAIVTTLTISGIAYCILKYKTYSDDNSPFMDPKAMSLKRKNKFSSSACPSKFSTAEYKSIHQNSITAV